MRDRRRRLLLFAVVVAVVIGAITFLSLVNKKSATLRIEAVPSGSTITLNGKNLGPGTQKVMQGNIEVVVSHPGFDTQKRTIQITSIQEYYSGFVLNPNSTETANWYTTHPEDEKIGEKITGDNLQNLSKQAVTKSSLITLLPHIDLYKFYRIDYGGSVAHPNDPAATAIFITYYDISGKQSALDWIKSQGYNPSTLEIVYMDKTGADAGSTNSDLGQ